MKARMLMNVALVLGAGLCLGTGYGASDAASSPAPDVANAQIDKAEQLFQIGEFCYMSAMEQNDEEVMVEKVYESIEILKQAAELGHPGAMAGLASLYREEEDLDVPWVDEAKSVEWSKRAWSVAEPKAKAGDVKAQYAMAILCDDACDRIKDPKERRAKAVEAQTWCQKAAEGGYAPAMEYLAYFPVSDDLKACAEASMQWITRAAEEGLASSMLLLTRLYHPDDEERSYILMDLFEGWREYAEEGEDLSNLSLAQLSKAVEEGDLNVLFAMIEKYDKLGEAAEDEEKAEKFFDVADRWAERWEENFVRQTGLKPNLKEAKKWARRGSQLLFGDRQGLIEEGKSSSKATK